MASPIVPIPTPWSAYNLSASPYFQEPLEGKARTPRPLSLFVGRAAELDHLLTRIRGAGAGPSRQAIAGAPGIGKTTLVKELKARALAAGYLTSDAVIPIVRDDTVASLFGRVLSALYDTIVANRPHAVGATALQHAEALVRVARLGTGGVSLSAFGVGAGVTRGTTVLAPKDILYDGPRIVRDLSDFVLGSDARGVLLHLNNLENLTEADAQRAADVLRDLRDTLLTENGLHFVFTGTPDAVAAAVTTHDQLKHLVPILRLTPLAAGEVHALLAARYAYLCERPGEPVVPPVDAPAIELLYELFRGDLRGLLRAAEDGVTPLLSLNAATGARPATAEELRAVLQTHYAAELREALPAKRVEQLRAWGATDPARPHTQATLKARWKVSQPTVSDAVHALVREGYVLALPRQGTDPIQYVLSGKSRLIFG